VTTRRDEPVQRLLDRRAILDCVRRYARGVDRVDEELVRSAYHPDAVDDHRTGRSDFVAGVDDFIARARELQQESHMTQHYLTTHNVELDGDVAHSETYFFAARLTPDRVTLYLSGGRYLDRLERRDGDWRIAARVVVGEWTTKLDNTARQDTAHPAARDRSDPSYLRPLRIRAPELTVAR
jgi:hypothetical protein